MSNDQQIAVSNPAAQPEREAPPPVGVAEDAFTPPSSPDDYHLDYIGPDGEPLQLDARDRRLMPSFGRPRTKSG